MSSCFRATLDASARARNTGGRCDSPCDGPKEATLDLSLRLNPALDRAALADTFARTGRVQIAPFLAGDAAERLRAIMEAGLGWSTAVCDATGRAQLLASDATGEERDEQRRTIAGALVRARARFSYLYLCYPMIEALKQGRDPGHPIHLVTAFLNAPETLDFLRNICGAQDVLKLDAQATCYRPGDFLSLHDDADQNQRVAAYTLGFTRNWRADWGGQLLFHDARGDVAEGFVPRFNTLTLFRVPRLHSVAPVAHYAGELRFSVTGWLRTDPPNPDIILPALR